METWSFPDGSIANLVERRQIFDSHQVLSSLLPPNCALRLLIKASSPRGQWIGIVEGEWHWISRFSLFFFFLFFSLFFLFSRLIPRDSGRRRSNRPLLADFGRLRGGNSPNQWYRPVASGPRTNLLADRYGQYPLVLQTLLGVQGYLVEAGNPNVIWSASEDGTLRQHDLREVSSCPSAGSSNQECRNVLVSS
ncbi:hypothetical protein BHM03_00000463 [Ensete ventricosum]|nr:hypothetical protein BHM03_00000463 [Ensete ventricosum]